MSPERSVTDVPGHHTRDQTTARWHTVGNDFLLPGPGSDSRCEIRRPPARAGRSVVPVQEPSKGVETRLLSESVWRPISTGGSTTNEFEGRGPDA